MKKLVVVTMLLAGLTAMAAATQAASSQSSADVAACGAEAAN